MTSGHEIETFFLQQTDGEHIKNYKWKSYYLLQV